MRVTQTGPAWVTIGAIIAILVLVIAVLGVLGVVPDTATVVFGLIGALAVARLI
jgi:hypothetical protein